jgi:hypothetical protein
VSARGPDKRLRALTTPEGLAMPVTLAGRGARAAALALDLGLIVVGFIAVLLLLASVGLGLGELEMDAASPVLEFIVVQLRMPGRYLRQLTLPDEVKVLRIQFLLRDGDLPSADFFISILHIYRY